LTLELTPRFTVQGVSITISALAEQAGVRPDTLRYYERLGLLRPYERSKAGYRLYDEAAAERLRFIKGAQRMGLRLADVKELLVIQDRGECPCGHTRGLVERRLAETRAEIAQLRAVESRLLDLERQNRECLEVESEPWCCPVQVRGGER
jgi:DNA-binding transcriptional MerR regulator